MERYYQDNSVTSDNSSTKILLVAILSSRDNASTPEAVASAETKTTTRDVNTGYFRQPVFGC